MSRTRRTVYALAAIVLGTAAALLLLELVCRATSMGDAPRFWPSRMGYQQVGPVFSEFTDDQGRIWCSGGRLSPVRPSVFPKKKSADSFRVFVFGGSAAWGFGFYGGGSFASLLERLLAQRYPDRDIEVINMAQVGYASGQILLRVEEVLADYDPDLLIIYSGHNEALELKAILSTTGQDLESLDRRKWLRDHSGLYRALKKLAIGYFYRPGKLGLEGADVLTGDRQLNEVEIQRVREQFSENMERIIGLAERSRVPLIMSTLAWNGEYQNYRPERCPYCEDATGDAKPVRGSREEIESAWAVDWAFTLCELGRCSEAGKLPVGDQSLGGYILAKCYLADGGAGWGQAAIGPTVELMRSDNRWKDDQALAVLYVDALWTLYSLEPDAELLQEMLSVYEQAKESMLPGLLDPTGPEPRRLSYMARLTEDLETAEKVERALLEMGLPTADSVINGMILTYADQPGVSVIDVESRLRQRSANGIVGYNFLLDYCHPNFDGAMTIALMLAAEIESRELAGTPDDAVDMEQLAARIREGFWKRGFDETDVRYFTGVGPWPVMLYNPNPPLSWRARQAREVVAAGDADPLTDLYAAYADLFDNQYSVEDVEGRLIPRIRGIAEADPSIPGLRTSMAWLALSVGDAQRAIEILWEEDAALDPEAGRRMIRWINDAP